MTEKSPGLNGKTDEFNLIKTKEIFRCLDFDFMTLLNFVDFQTKTSVYQAKDLETLE